ncbi:hypothetical protein B0H16DRAFT_1839431 [Mycena metata]|uniref:Uncharacterized protein n=1 Tax=Mycena metata TaxID=1033252 RepID=A0AAD7DTH7_9AGAR|nr:hypothetical protein B0H16DRAFT_1839431 [Mycena metata]
MAGCRRDWLCADLFGIPALLTLARTSNEYDTDISGFSLDMGYALFRPESFSYARSIGGGFMSMIVCNAEGSFLSYTSAAASSLTLVHPIPPFAPSHGHTPRDSVRRKHCAGLLDLLFTVLRPTAAAPAQNRLPDAVPSFVAAMTSPCPFPSPDSVPTLPPRESPSPSLPFRHEHSPPKSEYKVDLSEVPQPATMGKLRGRLRTKEIGYVLIRADRLPMPFDGLGCVVQLVSPFRSPCLGTSGIPKTGAEYSARGWEDGEYQA